MRKTWLVAGVGCVLVAVVPTTAQAKSSGTPFTLYAYEEVGPHSLLADPSSGVQFMDPVCSPSWTNCKVFEFADQWDLAPTDSATAADVTGYLADHAFDYFAAHTTTGTFTISMFNSSTTWTGGYSGVFRGPNAGTGTFSLTGTDGSKMTGSITFVDDGLMELTGVKR